MMSFTRKCRLPATVGVLSLLTWTSHAATENAAEENAYAVLASLPGPDGMWDYATVGSAERRLYLAQTENISILDLRGSPAWTEVRAPGATWHGVVPLESRGLLLATDGHAHAVVMFEARSGETVATVSTNPGQRSALEGRMALFAGLADPDALVADPKTGFVAAVNGGSGEVVFVDVDRRTAVGRAHVGGKLEFAVADGKGNLYVNVQTAHEIAVIDTSAFKVTRRIPMEGCVEPKGLAYDPGTDMLVSGCDNGVAKFILAQTGKHLVSLNIGRGADAVMIDAGRHRAFVASGADAILSIFDIHDPKHVFQLQTLSTENGTRLGAVDAQTGLLYLPSGKLGPPVAPRPWPSVLPGTFHVLVVGLSRASVHASEPPQSPR
jgi:DNA-binding beta-propeller fold protein YncE